MQPQFIGLHKYNFDTTCGGSNIYSFAGIPATTSGDSTVFVNLSAFIRIHNINVFLRKTAIDVM